VSHSSYVVGTWQLRGITWHLGGKYVTSRGGYGQIYEASCLRGVYGAINIFS